MPSGSSFSPNKRGRLIQGRPVNDQIVQQTGLPVVLSDSNGAFPNADGVTITSNLENKFSKNLLASFLTMTAFLNSSF